MANYQAVANQALATAERLPLARDLVHCSSFATLRCKELYARGPIVNQLMDVDGQPLPERDYREAATAVLESLGLQLEESCAGSLQAPFFSLPEFQRLYSSNTCHLLEIKLQKALYGMIQKDGIVLEELKNNLLCQPTQAALTEAVNHVTTRNASPESVEMSELTAPQLETVHDYFYVMNGFRWLGVPRVYSQVQQMEEADLGVPAGNAPYFRRRTYNFFVVIATHDVKEEPVALGDCHFSDFILKLSLVMREVPAPAPAPADRQGCVQGSVTRFPRKQPTMTVGRLTWALQELLVMIFNHINALRLSNEVQLDQYQEDTQRRNSTEGA